MKKLILVFSLMLSTKTMAGWVSGGGELVGNSQNPWFLQNTKTVNYCVQIDEVNFGQNKQTAINTIRFALEFWKEDFKYALPKPLPNKQIPEIATQDFILTDCNENTDIVFQFGVLSEEQKQKIHELSKIVGVSIRTDYDEVNLKGKGFVYIAPAYGPLKLQGQGVAENPWGKGGGNLAFILLHELGHVFGIPHVPGSFYMNETFAEDLVKEKSMLNNVRIMNHEGDSGEILPSFFKFRGLDLFGMSFCASPKYSPLPIKFWGGNEKSDCYKYKINNDKIEVFEGMDLNPKSLNLIGEVTFDGPSIFGDQTSVVYVYLTEEQKVFDINLNEFGSHRILGGQITKEKRKGTYKSLDGKIERRVMTDINPWGLKSIGGTMENEIYMNIPFGW